MRAFGLIIFLGFSVFIQAQESAITGQLLDDAEVAILYANVVIYNSADSSIYKVEATDEQGYFAFRDVAKGTYFLTASYIGYADYVVSDLVLAESETMDLGVLALSSGAIELEEAVVTAKRALVEVKADRMVFNVDGTINSVGSDAIALLRKAPGVTVDNNDNINVLGRSGVIIYIDGKRLPLTGVDLSTYLQSLTADQIDKIDIISNPGAKYEAEGNAGIIDIILKKDENLGANGSITTSYSKGIGHRLNSSLNGNYRTKNFNLFGTLAGGRANRFNETNFLSYQNGVELTESNDMNTDFKGWNYRIGTDFFLSKEHTLGFIVTGRDANGDRNNDNRIEIANQSDNIIDSILVAQNIAEFDQQQNTYNLNYRWVSDNSQSLNIDLDYGRYKTDAQRFQPNDYYNSTETEVLTSVINAFDTPTTIDIYTAKLDYESDVLGGRLGIGSKLSQVNSDNTFKVFDVINGENLINNRKSNQFDYDEMVIAGYINFAAAINEKWSYSIGLRTEKTDANGNLQPFDLSLAEPPVELNYLSWFPSAGMTYTASPNHSFALNYGRRINRPDYNVLNPFNIQLSEISFEKGNPFLNPEIVNNIELGYTYAYRYNFKLGYSKTTDQITRLIGPDEEDERANFISWANLAEQTVFSLNISAPVDINDVWNVYTNLSASHINNQADYGNGAVVDVKAFSYSLYQQHTLKLPKGFRGEVSGWYSGPGVWGGVFEYETSWSLSLGLQKKFLDDQLNVRVSVDDIFFQAGWEGFSDFNGLLSYGNGNHDSRRANISVSYNFGNQNVKSRNRKTGIEAEAGRVSNG